MWDAELKARRFIFDLIRMGLQPIRIAGRIARAAYRFAGGSQIENKLAAKRRALLEVEMRCHLGFLFSEYGAKVVADLRSRQVHADATVVLEASGAIFYFMRHMGELSVMVAPSRCPDSSHDLST